MIINLKIISNLLKTFNFYFLKLLSNPKIVLKLNINIIHIL